MALQPLLNALDATPLDYGDNDTYQQVVNAINQQKEMRQLSDAVAAIDKIAVEPVSEGNSADIALGTRAVIIRFKADASHPLDKPQSDTQAQLLYKYSGLDDLLWSTAETADGTPTGSIIITKDAGASAEPDFNQVAAQLETLRKNVASRTRN
ncbi:MAG: hypothetical protein KGJ06_09080 [Pseudomonadota bacterium]|nr:hypothetical protein [Pseudomonadota bacterium]